MRSHANDELKPLRWSDSFAPSLHALGCFLQFDKEQDFLDDRKRKSLTLTTSVISQQLIEVTDHITRRPEVNYRTHQARNILQGLQSRGEGQGFLRLTIGVARIPAKHLNVEILI